MVAKTLSVTPPHSIRDSRRGARRRERASLLWRKRGGRSAARKGAQRKAEQGRRQGVLDRDGEEAPPPSREGRADGVPEEGWRLCGAEGGEAVDEAARLVIPPTAHLTPQDDEARAAAVQFRVGPLFAPAGPRERGAVHLGRPR